MHPYELPEIEIWRRDLERDAVGRKIKASEVNTLKAFPDHRTKKSVTDLLDGAKVESVDRLGLAIVLGLSNEQSLVVRLGGEGRLLRVPSKEDRTGDTQLVVTFTQGGDLRVIEPGDGSWIGVVPTEEVASRIELPRGLDFFARPVSWVDFRSFVLQFPDPLRLLLIDPDVFVGIGDVYADEILFEAGLRYDRPANGLSNQEMRRLNRALVGIMHDAIKYGGTSLPDRPFADLSGEAGSFGDHLQVFGKEGELSARSRAPIQKTTFKGHTVYFCETQV